MITRSQLAIDTKILQMRDNDKNQLIIFAKHTGDYILR